MTAYKTGKTPDYAAALANGGWDPATLAWPARVGEVLDIVWMSNSGPSGGFDFHPMHARKQKPALFAGYISLSTRKNKNKKKEEEKKSRPQTVTRKPLKHHRPVHS